MTPGNISHQTSPHDAHHVPLSTADKLTQDAAEDKRVRALAHNPDVVALRTEKVRTQVDYALWFGILLGLAFTMVNVQQFAAAGAPAWSLAWCAAWLLDPMVSVTLIAVLRAEQVTARYQVHAGIWAHRTKWFAFTATYLMNTWAAWHSLDPAAIVLHSVPPMLVFCAAETAPWLRDRLTAAVHAAGTHAGLTNTATAASPGAPETDRTPVPTPGAEHGPDPGARPAGNRAGRSSAASSTRRKLFGDYLAEARAELTPDVVITPAWVRSVTDCGRATSKKVADTLLDEHATRVSTADTAPAQSPKVPSHPAHSPTQQTPQPEQEQAA